MLNITNYDIMIMSKQDDPSHGYHYTFDVATSAIYFSMTFVIYSALFDR